MDLVMSEGQVILSVAFIHGADDIVMEVSHAEERDQCENAGIVKTSSIAVSTSEKVAELYAELVDILDEVIGEVFNEVHKPAPTRPVGGTRRRKEDADR